MCVVRQALIHSSVLWLYVIDNEYIVGDVVPTSVAWWHVVQIERCGIHKPRITNSRDASCLAAERRRATRVDKLVGDRNCEVRLR